MYVGACVTVYVTVCDVCVCTGREHGQEPGQEGEKGEVGGGL
jgi:hypothetical protein